MISRVLATGSEACLYVTLAYLDTVFDAGTWCSGQESFFRTLGCFIICISVSDVFDSKSRHVL
jgi:hypothetical protein